MLDELATIPLRGAEVNPDLPAFVYRNERVSYAELADQSLRFARYLRSIGVQLGDRVAIHQPKSIWSIIAIYGTLRAGGAYVPIDPNAPAARVARIMRDCDVKVIASQGLPPGRLTRNLSARTPTRHCIGEDPQVPGIHAASFAQALESQSTGALPSVTPEDLAYVLFTSGSTGKPKGIAHTHASASAYVRAAQALFRFSPEDCFAGISPLHFDMSTLDCFVAPHAGACTSVVPDAHSRFPMTLLDCLQKNRVSVIYTVPYVLQQLVERGGLAHGSLPSVRRVLFGGEPMHPGLLAGLMRALPDAVFGNVYGPAEVNQCMFAAIPSAPAPRDSAVPIGRFWPQARGLVVDADEQSVRPGESGELLVASETMMQGYWAHPDLTAASIVVRQTDKGPERYYRTGDRFREDAAGVFWYIGRMDRQVKVRGQRIELDEVEIALNAHPHVESGAVYSVRDREGIMRIWASVLTLRGREPSQGSIRAFMASRLPSAAVPEAMEFREDLPLTATGKIDRRALAQMRQRTIDRK